MTRPVVPREAAARDIDEAIAWYLESGSPEAASGFIDEVERAFAHIGRASASGSRRFAHELNIPELRFWPLRRYPHLVFYVELPDRIDVWRVLHGQRDIPDWMRDAEKD